MPKRKRLSAIKKAQIVLEAIREDKSVPVHDVSVGVSMSGIVSHHRSPLSIFRKLIFQLHNKPKDLSAL